MFTYPIGRKKVCLCPVMSTAEKSSVKTIWQSCAVCVLLTTISCLDEGELFHDDAHILYVNGAYRGDSDIGRLMHDFCCWNPEEMNFPMMREAARYYKENPKGVQIMSKVFEEIRREAEYEAKIDVANNLIAIGTMSLNVIASVTKLPLETIQSLSRQKPAITPSIMS